MIMGKPLICISNDSNQKINGKDEENRQLRLPAAYCDAVAAAGGIPIVGGERCAKELAQLCDGLLLSGGADVDPALYGEELLNDTVKCDPLRTRFEVELMNAFMALGKPVFGICRGCQLINCVLGGTLYQDLVEQKGLVHMNGKIRHEVYAEEGSLLHSLFGPVFKTNSTHHEAVKDVAPGLRVTARSVEGLVEGFEHESLPITAVQFHPERLTGALWDERTPDFAPLFSHFVETVRKDAEVR